MKLASLMAVGACVLAAACATTGATYRRGVAPKLFEHAPYYAGAPVTPGASRIAHVRVRYQLGAEQPAIFEPKADSGSPAAQLVAEMNRYLDSLGASVSVAKSGPEPGTPPDVKFSCRTSPVGSCLDQDDDDAGYQRLELSVGRPSVEWTTWAASALDSAGAKPSQAEQASALVDGFQAAFAIGAGLMLVGVILAAVLIRRRDVAIVETAESVHAGI